MQPLLVTIKRAGNGRLLFCYGIMEMYRMAKTTTKHMSYFKERFLFLKSWKKIANNGLSKIRPTYDMDTAILSFNLLVLIEGLAEIINLCNFLCVFNGVLTSSATRWEEILHCSAYPDLWKSKRFKKISKMRS